MAVSECDDFISDNPRQDHIKGSAAKCISGKMRQRQKCVRATASEIFGGPRYWQLNDVQQASLHPEAEVLRT